jgi:hypothetical protein
VANPLPGFGQTRRRTVKPTGDPINVTGIRTRAVEAEENAECTGPRLKLGARCLTILQTQRSAPKILLRRTANKPTV